MFSFLSNKSLKNFLSFLKRDFILMHCLELEDMPYHLEMLRFTQAESAQANTDSSGKAEQTFKGRYQDQNNLESRE